MSEVWTVVTTGKPIWTPILFFSLLFLCPLSALLCPFNLIYFSSRVHISVASVSGYIPSAKHNATAPFTALESGPHLASTFIEDEATRRAHIEATKRDAKQRKVVWDAETLGRIDMDDLDAEGEIDSEYQPSGSQTEGQTQIFGVTDGDWAPLGVRNEEGEIVPLSMAEKEALARENEAMEVDEEDEVTQEHFIAGQRESVPTCIRKLVCCSHCMASFLCFLTISLLPRLAKVKTST